MPVLKNTRFYLGFDPEGFLWDKRKQKFVSAHNKIPGTKEKPHRFNWGSLQVDGVALEFNTRARDYNDTTERAIASAIGGINWYLNGTNWSVKFVPTAEFDDEEWQTIPAFNKRLGCEPDYNAWTCKINPAPDGDGKRYRTGAGHIHIGWCDNMEIDDDLVEIGAAVSKEMDAVVGVASLLWDDDKRRRTLYGKAGAFRPKSYGMEYRTLSNAWLRSQSLRRYVIARTTQAIKNMMNKTPIHTDDVRTIINKNKADDALHWMQHHKITLPPKEHRVY